MGPSDVLNAVTKFPFVMVMTAYFVRGSIFLSINIPLIFNFNAPQPYTDFCKMLHSAIFMSWENVVKDFGAVVIIPLFLFFSILVGVLVTPCERLVGYTFTQIINVSLKIKLLARLFNKNKNIILFTGEAGGSDEYTALLSWFLTKPEKKLHWEWELYRERSKSELFYYVFFNQEHKEIIKSINSNLRVPRGLIFPYDPDRFKKRSL
jgi:hypothetical protein